MLKHKAVRFILCLFMLPISLVIGMPGVASAASSESVTFHFDNTADFDQTCKIGVAINAVTGGSQVTVGAGGWCQGVVIPSPVCDLLEVECTTVSLTAKDGDGAACGGMGGIPITGLTGSYTRTATLGSTTLALGGCDPAELCLTLGWQSGDGAQGDTECVSTGLDAPTPVEVVDGCEATNFTVINAPVIQSMSVIPASGMYRVRVVIGGDIPGPASGTATESWHVYMVGQNLQGTTTVATVMGTLELWTGDRSIPAVSNTAFTLVSDSGLMGLGEANDFLQNTHVHGIGMYSPMPGDNTSSLKSVPLPNGTNAGGRYGISRLDKCAYYWGEKIADYGTVSPYDEPIGPIAEPPTVEEPPPVVEDPDDDENPDDEPSFWGAILAILKAIWSAITGLGSAIAKIATSIINGLKDLFIPDEGFLDNRVENLTESWDDTSVAKYSATLTDIELGSVSGCGGLPLNVDLGGGVVIDENVGAACSGGMASAAGVVRVVLSALVVIGGCVACVRAVGSGFGWNPGIGQGGVS